MGLYDKHLKEQNKKLLAENAELRAQIERLKNTEDSTKATQKTLDEQLAKLAGYEKDWQRAIKQHQRQREHYNELIAEARDLVLAMRSSQEELNKDIEE